MQVVIGVIGVLGAAGTIIFLSFLNMNGGIKAALVVLLVLTAVYGMARIQPKETTSEKDIK